MESAEEPDGKRPHPGQEDLKRQALEPERGPLPPAIKELIERHVAARAYPCKPPPRPGQIVRLPQLERSFEAPLWVLLDGPDELTSGKLWWGWICAPETDYASWWDYVLQEEDGPFSPEVGMVQVWNGVHVPVALLRRSTVVGELRPETLQAVRALTAEFLTSDPPGDVQPSPGKVALRHVGDHLLVTGSPLGDPEWDPRHRYQALYLEAAEALREAAREALDESDRVSPLDRLRAWWDGLGRWCEPEPVVAMAGESPTVDYLWREGSVRLRLLDGDLMILAEGPHRVIVSLQDRDGLLIERQELPAGEAYTVELDRPDLAAIWIESGGKRLEIMIPLDWEGSS